MYTSWAVCAREVGDDRRRRTGVRSKCRRLVKLVSERRVDTSGALSTHVGLVSRARSPWLPWTRP